MFTILRFHFFLTLFLALWRIWHIKQHCILFFLKKLVLIKKSNRKRKSGIYLSNETVKRISENVLLIFLCALPYVAREDETSGKKFSFLPLKSYSVKVSIANCIPSLKACSKIADSAKLMCSSQQSWNFWNISFWSSVMVFSKSSWCRAIKLSSCFTTRK